MATVIYVGSTVNYSPYVELGTGQYATTGGGTPKPSWVYMDEFGEWHRAYPQKPRPFLVPAIRDNKEEFRGKLIDSLENA